MSRQVLFDHRLSSKVYIALGALVGIFLITTIVFAALYGVQKNKASTAAVNDELCVTPYCVKAANYILESIDETTAPCEDFFQFACGTWLKNNRIPDDAGSQDTFNVLRSQLDSDIVELPINRGTMHRIFELNLCHKLATNNFTLLHLKYIKELILTSARKDPANMLTQPLPDGMTTIRPVNNARLLYDSCVNETAIEADGVNTILAVVNNELGGWPILQGPSWNPASFNLSRLLLKLREHSNSIIYSVGTSIDDKNSSVYYIRVSQSDLALEQRSNYINATKLISAYQRFIRDFATLLATDKSSIDQDTDAIFSFEKDLSQFHYTPAEQRAKQNETVRTTVGNLSETFDTDFGFTNYLRQVYATANVTLNENDIVSISELDFLRNASAILARASPRTAQNYLVWRFMMNRVSDMPKQYRSIREPFDRTFRGTSAEKPRSITCGGFVNSNMGFAVSKIYITRYFDENARNQSSEMIQRIRAAFIEMIRESTWMDESSKTSAIEKAMAIDEKIGYPEYLGSSNTSELDNMYSQYVFSGLYVSNVLKLLQVKSRESLQRLREAVDRKAWGTSPPTVVNAFYTASRNQISFPAGILQTPFFHKDAPKYLNYGGIGAVIGHEITHGFDDNGRQFDKDGNRVLWWTPATIEKFIERKTCIVNQYSNYTVAQINQTVNGNQTQGENIADNGGIKEAFYAYKKLLLVQGDRSLPGLKNYTSEQLFFIWYARFRCYSEYNDYAAYVKRLFKKQSTGHAIDEFR